MSEHTWTPETLIHYPSITDLDISADGERIVYAVREPTMTEEESKFINHLYLISTEGGEPLRLTYGEASHSSPRWSPDGRYIAFLSDRADDENDLYVMRADGGEAWPLTRSEKGVQKFAWSPDSTRLALSMVAPDSEEEKEKEKAKNDPILWDVDHDRAQLWVLPLTRGVDDLPEPQAVTKDTYHVTDFDWTPDGTSLAFVHQPRPVEDDWPKNHLALVEVDKEEPQTREIAHVGAWNAICKARGEWIACTTGEPPIGWTIEQRIVLYPLTEGEPLSLAMTEDARPFILDWSGDGRYLYVLENSGTCSAIHALPTDGAGPPSTLIDGRGYLSQVRASNVDTFAMVAEDMEQPNQICTMRADTGEQREVAHPVGQYAWPNTKAPESELLHWRSDGGEEDMPSLEIEGILTLPLADPLQKPYPTLVVVHGGPMSLFSQTYLAASSHYPLLAFAERGYAILRVNPRGSGGYGADFRAANKRDWGGGDYADIMQGLDLLIARGISDPERLGIMGWSYGGYMTSWVITQTSRFKAASVGAGVTNLMSFNGTTDIPGFVPDYFDAEFWEDLAIYREHSPMFQIEGVTTPTLIQHGEEDKRVPLGQGKELYNALKGQGVKVEMVIYPRQEHGPSEPRLIVDIMQRNLDWFDRWIMNGDES
ncbi:MAG: alpha/beta fold hydrolase [Anaerolineales bacterium]